VTVISGPGKEQPTILFEIAVFPEYHHTDSNSGEVLSRRRAVEKALWLDVWGGDLPLRNS
jgi:hypothetical protein